MKSVPAEATAGMVSFKISLFSGVTWKMVPWLGEEEENRREGAAEVTRRKEGESKVAEERIIVVFSQKQKRKTEK